MNKVAQRQGTKLAKVKLATYTLVTIAIVVFAINTPYQMLATQGFNKTTALATALSIIVVGVTAWIYLKKAS